MRASYWLLPLLLLAALGPRLAYADSIGSADSDRVLTDIAATLQRAGFTTRLEDRERIDNIAAARSGCALIATAETRGSRLTLLAANQPSHWRQHLFFKGREVTAYPRWQLTLNAYLQQQLGRIGISYAYRPMVVVVAEPTCDLRGVTFADVMIRPAHRR